MSTAFFDGNTWKKKVAQIASPGLCSAPLQPKRCNHCGIRTMELEDFFQARKMNINLNLGLILCALCIPYFQDGSRMFKVCAGACRRMKEVYIFVYICVVCGVWYSIFYCI